MKLDEPASSLDRWALSPDIHHVNHGSYGGCPLGVIDAATTWRERLESAPMKFFVLDWQRELDAAREVLGEFLRAPTSRLAFVPNATTGVAIALASQPIEAGDEIVTTDHAYRACFNQLARIAHARGLTIRLVKIPLPFDADATVAAFTAAINPRTKLAVIDHITSPTALVLPLERIVPLFEVRGIAVIVDGAHAPGQLAVNVGDLLDAGVTWYAGNNHKWLCAPKGTGFLAASQRAPAPSPVITSHGASAEYGPPNRFQAELDWMGTHDPTPHLTVPTAVATLADYGNGWHHIIARNHALVLELRDRLADDLGATALAGDDDLGTMASLAIELPPNTKALDLEMRLLAEGWEVPIVSFHAGPLVRISAHLYNHAHQAAQLAKKLRSVGVTGRRL
jgi:isopenicillin-N epimerase